MKIYVGVTDNDWFSVLQTNEIKTANFWRPGKSAFKALDEGGLFLFKLHAPYNFIVGGGYFKAYNRETIKSAWDNYGVGNGTLTLKELEDRLNGLRYKNYIDNEEIKIGCIILEDCFYLKQEDWINVPEDWKSCIVSGKSYNTDSKYGQDLFNKVMKKLNKNRFDK